MAVGSPSVRAFFPPIPFSLASTRCSLIKVNKPTSWVRRSPGNCGGPSTPSSRRFIPLFYSPLRPTDLLPPVALPLSIQLSLSSPRTARAPFPLFLCGHTYIYIYIFLRDARESRQARVTKSTLTARTTNLLPVNDTRTKQNKITRDKISWNGRYPAFTILARYIQTNDSRISSR